MFFKKKQKHKETENIIEPIEEAIELTSAQPLPTEEETKKSATEDTPSEHIQEYIPTQVPSLDSLLSSLEKTFGKMPVIGSEEVEEQAISESEEQNQEENNEEQGFAELDGKEAIYILGENALAIYLAIRFTASGEKVILIPSKENASTLSNNGITLIENHSLQKSHHKFATTFWLKETPKMLIITSEANKINAAITAISRKKIENIPVVLFTPIRDIEYIKNILNNDVYRAFFEGYLMKKPTQINLYGRAPSMTLCKKDNEKRNQIIKDYFEQIGIPVKTETDEIKAFWDFFGVYTSCSLISAAYNKNIFDVIKDRDKRDKMIPLILELCKISKADGGSDDQEEILKKIYNTPLSYPYPLQAALCQGKAGDIDIISSNILNTARKYNISTPETGILLKKIYNIIMA